ncbi:MAG: NAD(P)-dependent oxidoreductase [Candidatus Peribacteraceae bacterium]|nr:NAD(P)-dependent oxidoreductase [Candidatus Peribacteraceae bacterium]
MPSPTLFLEVDPLDRPMVTGQFPDAEVRSEALSGAELINACQGKEAVCCFIYSKFTKEVIEALPDLKLLCTRSVGYNHIDIAACRAHGITVCNVPDYGSHVIAEHVFALLLSALRHVTEGDSKVESGNFDYHGLRGMALMGKTIGIVGTGKIGFCVAKIAHGFGMRILAVDKCRIVELEAVYGVKYVDLDTLYKESDILTLHVPALPDTMHMIDAKAIGSMRSGVIIVNTARGELIDSTALLEALESGKVARALLDVLEHEQDFQLNEKLIRHKNVIVTPHIAFYADDSTTRMFLESLYSIHQWQWKEKVTHEVKPPTVVCDLPGVKK